MARATKNVDVTVTLELSQDEAKALVEYLSIHSLSSSVKTSSIFYVLYDVMDYYPSASECMEILARVRLSPTNLVAIDAEAE